VKTPTVLVGVDVGTYSTKGVVVDQDGTLLRSATVQHRMSVPRPGWAEHDAESVWWKGLVGVITQLLGGSPYRATDIAAVGVSAIGPCMLPVDEQWQPLRPAILYGVDTRAGQEIVEIEREIGTEDIRRTYRMNLSSQAVGPKILWYRRHEPHLWKRTARIMTASSYLVHRLTGALVMDHHQAAHYLPLYDPASHTWTHEYTDVIAPPGLLPELRWCDEVVGEVSPTAAEQTGLRAGTPVVTGGVDALLEALSVGVAQPGDLMIMYGSTAFFILITDQALTRPPLWSLPGAFDGTSVLAGGMATAGSATRWFIDLLEDERGSSAYDELFAAAATVPPGSAGLLALPYFSGERTPISDPDARGVIAGLSLAHRREHVFRALLEGVGFGIRHNLELLDAPESPVTRCVAVGGGTTSDLWTQIVSDISGRHQEIPERTIGASLGDALVAGLGIGAISSAEVDSWVTVASTVTPNPTATAVYDERYGHFRELYARTADIIHGLAVDQRELPPL
jgi:xylulokinase